MGLTFFFIIITCYRELVFFKYSIKGPPAFFFVLRPVTLPQPGLGRIAEQVLVA
jgi:hypothetical protein